MFSKDDIYLDVEAKDHKDLFTKMNKIFLEKGYVKEGYLESILEREKDYPTGLMFEKHNVAIPHTLYQYVNEQKIVFVRLKDEIKFGEMSASTGEIEVKLVFMLLISKGEEQVTILLNLIELLENYENYLFLEKSNDIEEIYNLLVKKYG